MIMKYSDYITNELHALCIFMALLSCMLKRLTSRCHQTDHITDSSRCILFLNNYQYLWYYSRSRTKIFFL